MLDALVTTAEPFADDARMPSLPTWIVPPSVVTVALPAAPVWDATMPKALRGNPGKLPALYETSIARLAFVGATTTFPVPFDEARMPKVVRLVMLVGTLLT